MIVGANLTENEAQRRMRCVNASETYKEAAERLAEYGDIIGSEILRRWVSKHTRQPGSMSLKEKKGDAEEARQIAIMNARTIREYWKAKGHDVNARAVYRDRIWTVESNLVNGAPQ
jgi:transposase-like protein